MANITERERKAVWEGGRVGNRGSRCAQWQGCERRWLPPRQAHDENGSECELRARCRANASRRSRARTTSGAMRASWRACCTLFYNNDPALPMFVADSLENGRRWPERGEEHA